MLKKRRLTATFRDMPEEKDSLRRSWRTGIHSDWTLDLGPQKFAIHKVLVATGERASAFLAASFKKHCGQSERTDLTELVPKRCWPYLEAVLDYMYNGEIEVTAENWSMLVKMADLLQIGALFSKCVEAGSDLITSKTAPTIVADTMELKLGGNLEQEVVQIAADVIAPSFSSYKPQDLTVLPLQAFEVILQRDDLEVANEDEVFDFLLRVSAALGQADMKQLWKCCRLQHLSPEKVLDLASISEIPKEAVVLALAQQRASVQRPVTMPAWAQGWGEAKCSRGREIRFFISNPAAYAHRKNVRSAAHRLCDRFSWRLLIFPLGTESSVPRQTAAFVELQPDAGVDPNWMLRRVKYSITLVNFIDERKSVTKEHVFNFCAAELDNGWHRGWVLPDSLTTAAGWLNDRNELCFAARCCVRNASYCVHVPSQT